MKGRFFEGGFPHPRPRDVKGGIRARFADTRGMSVAGVGYATPYLGLFREEAERCLAFMPAAQGVVKWPSASPTLATLVEAASPHGWDNATLQIVPAWAATYLL